MTSVSRSSTICGSMRVMLNGRAPAFQADPSGFDSRRPLRSNARPEYIMRTLGSNYSSIDLERSFQPKATGRNPVRGRGSTDSLLLQPMSIGGRPTF